VNGIAYDLKYICLSCGLWFIIGTATKGTQLALWK
jgi:hypothetical protein